MTKLQASYGYIFWTGPRRGPVRIGFARRPQLAFHDGILPPWEMATVGGVRDREETLEQSDGPNGWGFMGRPPSGEEIARTQLRLQLGVKIDAEFYVPPLEGWLEALLPFYHDDATPEVRNVGLVKRKVRRLETTELKVLDDALAARNPKVNSGHVMMIRFFTQEEFLHTVLAANHVLKGPEALLLRKLYDVLADKNQYHFQAEAHLAVAD